MRRALLSLLNRKKPLYERQKVQKFLATHVARPSSAGIILENQQGDALLLKAHYKPYWSFPGGWVEDTQSPKQAALRELEEEAGITLADTDIEFAYVVDRVSDIMHTYQFMFRAVNSFAGTDSIVLQTSEIAEWRFVDKATVLAQESMYGGAVLAWARGDMHGYVEQRIEAQ